MAFRDAGDTDLTELCQIKANYWLDSTNWTVEQLDQAGIRLVEMRRELDRRLGAG